MLLCGLFCLYIYTVGYLIVNPLGATTCTISSNLPTMQSEPFPIASHVTKS